MSSSSGPPHRDDYDDYSDDGSECASDSKAEYTDDDEYTINIDDEDYYPESESESEDEWYNVAWFKKSIYAVANMSSNLTVNDIKFMSSIYLIPEEYTCVLPKPTNKIYESQVLDDQIGIGLSKFAFKCGLRFPLHPFYDEILEDAQIGLGQLLPNSFLQVNSFIDHCQTRGVGLQLRLFWHHYQLTTSAKASGFFSICLKAGSQQWIDTSGNNRGSHEAWFYLFGPDTELYMDWHDYIPRKYNPKLDSVEKLDYKELTKDHNNSMIMSSAMLRDEKFLNRVSIEKMSEESLLKVLEQKALAEVALKKSKKKPVIQKCNKSTVPHVEEKDSTSMSVDIAVVDASLIDKPPSPLAKKQKIILTKASDFTLECASSNSTALSKSLGSYVTYHAKDSEKLSKMSSISCGGEVRAFASQLYLWSLEQEKKSRLELARLTQLEDAADAAENRATDEMQKTALAEAKVAKLEEDAKAIAIREEKLIEKISSLEKELQEAKDARTNAEAHWLGVGLKRRLDMVKAANLDFKKCMFPYELKALELLEADDDNDEIVTSDANPTSDDADPKKTPED